MINKVKAIWWAEKSAKKAMEERMKTLKYEPLMRLFKNAMERHDMWYSSTELIYPKHEHRFILKYKREIQMAKDLLKESKLEDFETSILYPLLTFPDRQSYRDKDGKEKNPFLKYEKEMAVVQANLRFADLEAPSSAANYSAAKPTKFAG